MHTQSFSCSLALCFFFFVSLSYTDTRTHTRTRTRTRKHTYSLMYAHTFARVFTFPIYPSLGVQSILSIFWSFFSSTLSSILTPSLLIELRKHRQSFFLFKESKISSEISTTFTGEKILKFDDFWIIENLNC